MEGIFSVRPRRGRSATGASASVSASAVAAAVTVSDSSASATTVPATMSPRRTLRSPVASITIRPTMWPSTMRTTVRFAICSIDAGLPSAETTRSFVTRLPSVCPPSDSSAKK